MGCIPSKALLETTERIYEAKKGLLGAKVKGVELDLPASWPTRTRWSRPTPKGWSSSSKERHRPPPGHGPLPFRAQGFGGGDGGGAGGPLHPYRHGKRPLIPPWAQVDYERVVTSTEALSFPEVPKRLIVVGGGVIGLELGVVWHRLGAEVIVLEYMDRILPTMDAEVSRAAERVFKKQGLTIRTGVRVTAVVPEAKGARVELEGARSWRRIGSSWPWAGGPTPRGSPWRTPGFPRTSEGGSPWTST